MNSKGIVWSTTYSLVKAKQEERLEVVIADAIANPWTVVVHLRHADVANTAVMGPVWFPVAAALAVELLIRRCRLWDDLWTLERSHSV